MIKITTTTIECGYVYVSWNATASSDMCRITQYNVTLSSATINMTISISGMNSHNFTGLPDDTLFNVSVTGIKIRRVGISDSTSVRTPICISMYMHTYIAIYIPMYVTAFVHIVCFMC